LTKYIPDRNGIAWFDFEPAKGKEIGKYRPAIVLSSKAYNKATGLLICCPISTNIRNTPLEVRINNLDSPSVVATNLLTTLDWRKRKAKKAARADEGVFNEVLLRIIPLIGADQALKSL